MSKQIEKSIEKHKANMPCLRFPEFKNCGEWEEKKLGEMCARIGDGIHTTPMYAGKSSIYFINGNNLRNGKIIFQESTKFVDEHDAKKHRRNLSQRTLLMSINGTIGNLAYYKNENIILGKSACYINVDKYNNIDFIYHCLNSLRVQAFYNLELTGSTIRNLSLATIKLTPIAIPSFPEQQKIAGCLSSLDASINAHIKKFDLLKEYKKGLLQKLFPKEGQKIPEHRFPEFKNCEEWEEKTLGEVTYSASQKNSEGKKYPVYSINNKEGFLPQSEQFEGVDSNSRGYDIKLYKIVSKNTFAYNPARINVGSIGYSGELFDIIISSLYVCFKTNEEIKDNFLQFFLSISTFNRQVHTHAEGGIRSYLFYNNFSKILLQFPKKEEQQKIADCLSTLDKKIEAQSEKIKSLKEHKKGLMQQLFPQASKESV